MHETLKVQVCKIFSFLLLKTYLHTAATAVASNVAAAVAAVVKHC